MANNIEKQLKEISERLEQGVKEIDRILDMARTAVNITGDAVCTTIVACQNGAVDKEVFNKAE